MPYLAGFVTPQDFGAAGDGANDDAAAINASLSHMFTTFGGGEVLLPPTTGGYLVKSPVLIPPYTFLVGQSEISLNLNLVAPPTNVSRIIAWGSWVPAPATGIISILSKTPGGWSVNTASCGARRIFIDGSQNSSSNLQGIQLTGPVYDVHLEDVFIYEAPHNGINASSQAESGISPTFPYHQRWERVAAVNSGNTGFNLVNFTDSSFVDCLAFGNTGSGFSLQNNSNCQFDLLRSEWNTLYGYTVTGSSGGMAFTGCTTDQNTREGLYITGASGQSGVSGGGITWTGGKLHSDANGAVSGHTYGIQITGSTTPVEITGTNVEVGETSSVTYPANAIGIGTSSSVIVSGSMLQGASAAWVDNGGNSFIERRGCLSLIGAPGAAAIGQLAEIPAVNVPLPEDQNLLAWTFDPALQTANSTVTSGNVYLCRINVRQTATITNLLLSIATVPSGLTTGENFAGLYNSSGTLLSATADQTTNWATTGLKTMALSAAQTVAPGIYYLAFLANASTTTPAFARATVQGAATVNAGTTSSTPRYALLAGSATTLPSNITISATTANGSAWWGAFS